MKIGLQYIIIILLLGYIVVQQQCVLRRPAQAIVSSHTDTTYIKDTGTVQSQPAQYTTIAQNIPPAAAPDTNYALLRRQYDSLASAFYAMRIFRDTLRKDSSYVAITDTTQRGIITGRGTHFSIATRYIKETNNIPPVPHRQLYIGGGVGSVNAFDGLQLHAGLLYKNRRDNITALSIGVNNTGQLLYRLDAYWKISLRRNP